MQAYLQAITHLHEDGDHDPTGRNCPMGAYNTLARDRRKGRPWTLHMLSPEGRILNYNFRLPINTLPTLVKRWSKRRTKAKTHGHTSSWSQESKIWVGDGRIAKGGGQGSVKCFQGNKEKSWTSVMNSQTGPFPGSPNIDLEFTGENTCCTLATVSEDKGEYAIQCTGIRTA